jgi:hypothetical protein
MDAEVDSRIAKANAAFGRLRTAVWKRTGIMVTTKIKVYIAVVLTTFLYFCETQTVYSRHTRRLQHFYTIGLRRVQGHQVARNDSPTQRYLRGLAFHQSTRYSREVSYSRKPST